MGSSGNALSRQVWQCKLLKRDNIQNIVSSYKFKVCKCVLLCFFKKNWWATT